MMQKPIAIIQGEPNSVSSEIILKLWKKRKTFKHKPFFIIGNYKLLDRHKKFFGINCKLKKINQDFKIRDLNSSSIPILDVKFNQKKIFEKISKKSNSFIFTCFKIALRLIKSKKIFGLINCPISKETLLHGKYKGITEFISSKLGYKNKEVMLIFNKEYSVSPITTHIPIKKISKNLSKKKIIYKIKTIDSFYKKYLKKKTNFVVTGLNPHCYNSEKFSEEKNIIKPAINYLKKKKIKISGPYSADSLFAKKNNKFNIVVGMYHDQVLTPIKSLKGFDAINVTIGLPCIRVSPDHGVASDIVGKGKANPKSLIESIKFFNLIK